MRAYEDGGAWTGEGLWAGRGRKPTPVGLLPKLLVIWMSELAAPRTVGMIERNASRAVTDGGVVKGRKVKLIPRDRSLGEYAMK